MLLAIRTGGKLTGESGKEENQRRAPTRVCPTVDISVYICQLPSPCLQSLSEILCGTKHKEIPSLSGLDYGLGFPLWPSRVLCQEFLLRSKYRGVAIGFELKKMGKRKSRAKPPPKKRMDKLDTVFSCPSATMDIWVKCTHWMHGIWHLAGERYVLDPVVANCSGATLTEPIDIYSEWIDECERVNNPEDDDA
ncbi:Transcription elongation factor 1 [Sesamum angolense]|uniref:Transcription elongation factor 1 n=1 Tax=Sesamum angolense TaxID=2727404 RepID=A0AAE1WRL0_9LAMI|nr:Transcription elongation factor 1 [Sesamum angolense]